jgi:hypothetical protein
VKNPRTVDGWLYKCFPRKLRQSRSSVCPTSSYSIFLLVMNTDPPPIIDPGERDELEEIFHRPGNETGADPTSDTPEVPEPVDPEVEQPDVPGPERPAPPGPVQPELPLPPPPKGPEAPKPGPPVRPEAPRPDPPRHHEAGSSQP